MTYTEQVQAAVDKVVEMAESAESANRHALSAWYGSVCRFIRKREGEGKGFTLTLPDPHEGGDPITVIEVAARPAVAPRYGAITAVRDICEPWIEIWGGDEWSESMHDLRGAAHTDYGLSDEDCAVVAEILLRNVIQQREWIEEEGHSYGLSTPEQEAYARAHATKVRDDWLRRTDANAKSVIDAMPEWMFEPSGEVVSSD